LNIHDALVPEYCMITILAVEFDVYNAPWQTQTNNYLGSLTPVGVASG
jgi:hypothetical protein